VRCRFSGLRIYPGRGIQVVRVDGTSNLFLNSKVSSLFHQKKKPAKIAWTAAYRRAHKKDQAEVNTRRKRVKVSAARARTFTSMTAETVRAQR